MAGELLGLKIEGSKLVMLCQIGLILIRGFQICMPEILVVQLTQ